MPFTEPMAVRGVAPRRRVYLVAGVVIVASAVVMAGLIFPALTRAPTSTGETPRLEGALRAGAPEFERYRERLVFDSPKATASSRTLGDFVVELKTNVRNETGHRLHGLEMRGVVINAHGTPVGERTAVIIPLQQAVLEPGEEINVRMLIEGVSPDAERAGARLEVTALRFE
jgi:hypothetical protein